MNDNVQAEALKQSRARRAEEWEKVRNPDVITDKDREDDFEEKTLYERLQENRELKRLEIEEQFRYKNMVYSGLDNDEHKFLEAWENSKKDQDKARQKEDCEELQKYKARVIDLDSGSVTLTSQTVIPIQEKKMVSKQKQMLFGIVKKRKSDIEKERVKVAKIEEPSPIKADSEVVQRKEPSPIKADSEVLQSKDPSPSKADSEVLQSKEYQAISLTGLGAYSSGSDSEDT